MFFLRDEQHLVKGRGPRPAGRDRGVAPRLVDHQHVAGIWGRQFGVAGIVFRQVERLQSRHAGAGAVQKRGDHNVALVRTSDGALILAAGRTEDDEELSAEDLAEIMEKTRAPR